MSSSTAQPATITQRTPISISSRATLAASLLAPRPIGVDCAEVAAVQEDELRHRLHRADLGRGDEQRRRRARRRCAGGRRGGARRTRRGPRCGGCGTAAGTASRSTSIARPSSPISRCDVVTQAVERRRDRLRPRPRAPGSAGGGVALLALRVGERATEACDRRVADDERRALRALPHLAAEAGGCELAHHGRAQRERQSFVGPLRAGSGRRRASAPRAGWRCSSSTTSTTRSSWRAASLKSCGTISWNSMRPMSSCQRALWICWLHQRLDQPGLTLQRPPTPRARAARRRESAARSAIGGAAVGARRRPRRRRASRGHGGVVARSASVTISRGQ